NQVIVAMMEGCDEKRGIESLVRLPCERNHVPVRYADFPSMARGAMAYQPDGSGIHFNGRHIVSHHRHLDGGIPPTRAEFDDPGSGLQAHMLDQETLL